MDNGYMDTSRVCMTFVCILLLQCNISLFFNSSIRFLFVKTFVCILLLQFNINLFFNPSIRFVFVKMFVCILLIYLMSSMQFSLFFKPFHKVCAVWLGKIPRRRCGQYYRCDGRAKKGYERVWEEETDGWNDGQKSGYKDSPHLNVLDGEKKRFFGKLFSEKSYCWQHYWGILI